MSRTVLVTSRSFGSGTVDVAGVLAATGMEVVPGPTNHELGELMPLLGRADAWIAGTAPITSTMLDGAPRLRVLARYGVDVDGIDMVSAMRHGIVVTNTPGANSEAVADHALGLLLAALRGIVDGDRRVREGRWTTTRGRELGSLTVGVIGFGRVGRGVARRLAGFGSTVVVNDPFLTAEQAADAGVVPLTLTELAAASDAVSLHAAGDVCLIDDTYLAACREGQVLVNTARAEQVDETAVAEALRSGRLAAYAADDLLSETHASPVASHVGGGPLLASDLTPSVLFTPHLAGQTVEAIDRMGLTAANDVIAVLAGRVPRHPVQLVQESFT